MNIIEKAIQEYELIVEENEDAISWGDESDIKDAIVSECGLEEWAEQYDIEQLYVYEMFDWDLPLQTKKDMAYVLIELLDNYR